MSVVKKIIMLMLLLAFTSTAVGSSTGDEYFVNIAIDGNENITFSDHTSSSTDGNWIVLNGGTSAKLPSPLTFGYYGINSTSYISNGKAISITANMENNTDHIVEYPYDKHPMLTNVSGKNDLDIEFYGSQDFANKGVDVYLIRTSPSSLKNAFDAAAKGDTSSFRNLLSSSYEISLNKSLNSSGDMSMSFDRVDAGDYVMFVLLNTSYLTGVNDLLILSATTFQVLEYDSLMSAPKGAAPDSTVRVSMSLINATDGSYTYGAMLVHKDAYRAAISLEFNGTKAGTNLMVNGADIIKGYKIAGVGSSNVDKTMAIDLINDMLGANNGTVTVKSTDRNSTSILLVTDGLRNGNYVLLVGVYKPGENLVAFGQSDVTISSGGVGTLTGTVKNPDGMSIQGAIISIDGELKATSDESGYQVTGLATGSHAVTVTKTNYMMISSAFDIQTGINIQDFILTPTKATISGTITDEIGVVKNAKVTINTTPQTVVYANTYGKYVAYVASKESGIEYSVDASAPDHVESTTNVIVTPAQIKTADMILNQNKVDLGLLGMDGSIQFADNGTNATFSLNIENYGYPALFDVTYSATTASIYLNESSVKLNAAEESTVVVNVTDDAVGVYPITITVSNSTQGKSASIDLVAVMRYVDVAYSDSTSNVSGSNVGNGSVVVDNSIVNESAFVLNGSVSNHSEVSGSAAVVDDSIVKDHSAVLNASVLNGSVVVGSVVSSNATVTGGSSVENSNVTLGSIVDNSTLTGVDAINSHVDGVELSNVTLENATVVSVGGNAQITEGKITIGGVEFDNIYEDTFVDELVIDQSLDNGVNVTSPFVDNRDSLGTYLNITGDGEGDVSVSVCSISPGGSFTVAGLNDGLSGETVVGDYIKISSTVPNMTRAEIRMYIDQETKDGYDTLFVAYHNTTTGELEQLETSDPIWDSEVGRWYVVAYTTHFSTYTLVGATVVEQNNPPAGNNNGGSGGGRFYRPTVVQNESIEDDVDEVEEAVPKNKKLTSVANGATDDTEPDVEPTTEFKTTEPGYKRLLRSFIEFVSVVSEKFASLRDIIIDLVW